MPIFILVRQLVLLVCINSALIMSPPAPTINKTPLNCFKKSRKFQLQFQLISLEINVDHKLTHARIRPCFEGKEPSLISKHQLLVLSKAKKSGSSFKFISIQTRIELNLFIEKRSTTLVSFKNVIEDSIFISNSLKMEAQL